MINNLYVPPAIKKWVRSCTILIVYVDKMVRTGTEVQEIEDLKK